MAYGQNLFQGLMNNQSGAPRGLPPTQGQNPNIANIMATLLGGYTGGGGGMAPGRGTIAPSGGFDGATAGGAGRVPFGASPVGTAPRGASTTPAGGKDLSGIDPSIGTRADISTPGVKTNPNNLLEFPGQGASSQDWMKYIQDIIGNLNSSGNTARLISDTWMGPQKMLSQFGGPTSLLAYSNLAQMLGQQGHIDPAAMNQQISGIQRGTQANQQGVQGELARRGLGASGIGQALSASTGQAGVNKIADVRASEAQMAEERRIRDLQMFMDMVSDPAFQQQQFAAGQLQLEKSNRAQERAARDAKWAKMAETFAALGTCHVAAELFGDGAIEVDGIRYHIATEAPLDFALAYARNSKAFAYEVIHSESLARLALPVFAGMAESGLIALGI